MNARTFPTTPNYSIAVPASFNMLDVLADEVSTWHMFDYNAHYENGDYANLDAITSLFKTYDNGMTYTDVDDEKDVKEYICRKKLMRLIDEARCDESVYPKFTVVVNATLRFVPCSGSSVMRDGQELWESSGSVTMSTPIEECMLDDEFVIYAAKTAEMNEFIEVYKDYVANYVH